MKFKKIPFTETTTERVYDNYLKQVKNVVKVLSLKDQDDVLMEINSHIYEGLQQNNSESELNSLLDIIDKLGAPEVVLQPLVADKKLEQATKSFNPVHVFKALMLNLSNGIFFVVVSVLYVLLSVFIIAIIGKILFPDYVGFYYKPGEIMMLGSPLHEAESYKPYEVLHDWFIPIMAACIVVFYVILTLLLKLESHFKRRRNKNWLQERL